MFDPRMAGLFRPDHLSEAPVSLPFRNRWTPRRSLRFSYKLRATIEPAMLTLVMTKLEAGDTLDHYRLDREVARSGMSTLFRATDLRTGQQVAVKVPHPEMEADPIPLERFRREE